MSHRPIVPEGRTAPAAEATTPSAVSARRLVLGATILGSAMAFIDGSVISIIAPAIQQGFNTDLTHLQWVSNAYTLLLGALILVGGGLGDRLGRRRIFILGVAVFAAASLACALAPTVQALIAARAVQGVGAALLVPQSLAIISACFPKEVRGRAIGTWAAASAVTTALGPPLGGFLVDLVSWRAAFWINLPLAAGTIALAWNAVPDNAADETGRPVDWTGAVLAVLGFGALTYALTSGIETGANPAMLIGAGLAGLALIAVFVLWERRAAEPLMPPDLFRSPMFTGTNLVTVFLYGALSAVLFLMPFDLIVRRGFSATEVGIIMLPFGLIIGAFSRLAGSLSDQYGPRRFLIAGPLLVGIATVVLATNIHNLWVGVVLPVFLFSAGMAVAVSPLTTAVMNSVPDARSGAASGINNAASRLAGVFAIALIGSVAAITFAAFDPTGGHFGVLPDQGSISRQVADGAFRRAYSTALGLAAAGAFLAAGLAAVFVRDEPKPAEKV